MSALRELRPSKYREPRTDLGGRYRSWALLNSKKKKKKVKKNYKVKKKNLVC